MSAKKHRSERSRREKHEVKSRPTEGAKLGHLPSDYFRDGYYYTGRYTRTVVAAGLANALVFE